MNSKKTRLDQSPNHHDHNHHSHGHGHHTHFHGVSSSGSRAIAVAFALNLIFCLVEWVGGFYAGSQAVLADALHDFGDSLSLGLLLVLRWYSQKVPTESYSYGYRRLNLVGASLVGLSLVLGSIFILGQSVPKIFNPGTVQAPLMMVLALLGVLVNGAAFWRLRSSSGAGEKMISLHLLEDLWGWVIVMVGAVAISLFSWTWLDPLLSVILAAFILWRTVLQFKDIGRKILLGAQSHFSPSVVESIVQKIPGVIDVHHVHVWELESDFHIVTVHLVLVSPEVSVVVKQQVRDGLERLGPCEITMELEWEGEICLDPVHPLSRSQTK